MSKSSMRMRQKSRSIRFHRFRVLLIAIVAGAQLLSPAPAGALPQPGAGEVTGTFASTGSSWEAFNVWFSGTIAVQDWVSEGVFILRLHNDWSSFASSSGSFDFELTGTILADLSTLTMNYGFGTYTRTPSSSGPGYLLELRMDAVATLCPLVGSCRFWSVDFIVAGVLDDLLPVGTVGNGCGSEQCSFEGTYAQVPPDVDAVNCSSLGDWDFPDTLEPGFEDGTINAHYDAFCEGAHYSGDWVNESVGPSNWDSTYPYSGSCLLAVFGYGYNWSTGQYEGSGLLIGGTVAGAVSGNSNYGPTAFITEVAYLVPSGGTIPNPCLMSNAIVVSQGAFAAVD